MGVTKPLAGPGDPRHGTASCYQHYGCRCDACTEANKIRQRPVRAAARARRVIVPSDLRVECWCRAAVVLVSPTDVLNLRTGSCGRTGCEAS